MSADDPRDPEHENEHPRGEDAEIPLHAHHEPDGDAADEDHEQDEDHADASSPPPLTILYNDPDEEDESDDEEEFDDRRTVLITGAAGNIGSKLRAAFEDIYDLILIDRDNPDDDPEIIVADLADWDEDWLTHFHGVDTVIHLAGNPNEFAAWEELVAPNIDALANVFHAAALAGVDRLVYASSNHAMGEYRYIGGLPITTDLPPKPDGPYGGLKLVGERFGRSLAKAFDMSFVAIRLGWIQSGENLPRTLPHDWAKTHWLSNRDLAGLFEGAIEADLGETPWVVVNGVSRNEGTRWDLTDAMEYLGFEPVDDAYREET